MSYITDLYRAPGQLAIFNGDDPARVGLSPHSDHCRALPYSRSWRHPGQPRYICVTACPRKSQLDRFEMAATTERRT